MQGHQQLTQKTIPEILEIKCIASTDPNAIRYTNAIAYFGV